MSNTLKLSWFVWGTLWFDSTRTLHLDSIHTESYLAKRLPVWRIDNRQNDSCRFDRIDSNRQHFQPTLHSPPEVKIREITIHEPSSFLKRGPKLQSIRMIRVDSIKSTRIDNIFNPPSKSRSTIFSKSQTNQLPENDSCRFGKIGFTNQFPVCRIANTKDESTLVGCIGQPSWFVQSCYQRMSRSVHSLIHLLDRESSLLPQYTYSIKDNLTHSAQNVQGCGVILSIYELFER